MSIFLKRRIFTLEDLEEIVNNSEDSEFSNDSSQSYDSDISLQKISRAISSESEDEEDFSDEEIETDMQYRTWTNAGTERPRFPFIGKPGLNVEIKNSKNPLEFFELFITSDITELISRETNR